MAGEDSNDDDYMPTVKEKEKVEKEKRREMQQKLQVRFDLKSIRMGR